MNTDVAPDALDGLAVTTDVDGSDGVVTIEVGCVGQDGV